MDRRTFLKVGIGVVVAAIGGSLGYYYLLQPFSVRRIKKHTITVVDTLDRTVTVPYPVESCIVTDDSIGEIVQAIGAEDTIIGIESSMPRRGYFPKLADKPITGNQWQGLNYELVAKLKPDVVIMYGHVAPAEQILKKLEEINIKAVCIDPAFVDGLRIKSIKLLGEIFGKEERAERFLSWREKLLSQLRERLSDIGEKVSAYIAMGFGKPSYGKLPTRTWGRNFSHNVTVEEWAKIRNIASDIIKTHGEVELEWIVKQNPDMFIIGVWSSAKEWDLTGYYVTNPSTPAKYISDLMANEDLKQTKAVKDRKIFLIDHLLTGTRAEVGALYLAKAAYPDRMEDLDPEKAHKEYFEKWLGVKYQGIWFYPQPWKEAM